MNCSTPGLPIHHQLSEFTQIHVCWVGDAIQQSHPLLPPSPFVFDISQNQSLFQWVGSWLFASGDQSIGASVSVLPMNIQGWFPLGLTGLISMLSKGLSRVFSSTSAVISTNITTSLPVVYSLSRNHFLYSLMKSNSSSTSFNNNLKVWNTVRITKMWHRDTKWVNAVGNIVLVDVAWCRVPTNHEFVKNPKIKQVKHNKTRHAYA